MEYDDDGSSNRENYSVSFERIFLIDASERNPKCGYESSDFGTFAICGWKDDSASFPSPQIATLSVICYEEYIEIFSENQVQYEDFSSDQAQTLVSASKEVPNLKSVLEGVLQSTEVQELLEPAGRSPIKIFVCICDQIFQAFIGALRMHTTSQMNGSALHPRNDITSQQQTTALFKALEALQRQYPTEQITHKVNEELQQLILQYDDPAGRNHQMQVNLSAMNGKFRILNCQVDLPKEALAQFSTPIHTVCFDQDEQSLPMAKRPKLDGESLDSPFLSSRQTGDSCRFPFSSSLSLLPERLKDNQQSCSQTVDKSLSVCYQEFRNIVDMLQDLWNEFDLLDSRCCISEPTDPSLKISRHSSTTRTIYITDDICLSLSLSLLNPRQPPEAFQFISNNNQDVASYKNRIQDSLAQGLWTRDLSVCDNLERCLGVSLPGPDGAQKSTKISSKTEEYPMVIDLHKDGNKKECGVCYTVKLESEEIEGRIELPTIFCENESCSRIYHESCLQEWLGSLPSSRVAFDVILGECPYCQEAISAPMIELY